MATRVRYIMKAGGSWYCGSRVREYLASKGALTLAQMKKTAAELNVQLWAFREPRQIAKKRSRYKLACWQLGIGRAAKKQPMPAPRIRFNQEGVPNGDANHGLAPQAGQAGGLAAIAANYQQFIWGNPPVEPPEGF